MKKGFTIVELMMVIGVIAILMGIITTAASSSMKAARARKADILCSAVQAGLAVYYEQKGEWPVTISTTGNQEEGAGNQRNPDSIELTGPQVRACVKALVDEAKQNNPMMDISGLFVSRQDGELQGGSKGTGVIGGNETKVKVKPVYGLDFMQAIRGTRKSQKKMKTGEMYFGYPDPETGYFLRFKMVYSVPGDTITVSKQR